MTWWGNSISIWGHHRPKGRHTVPWVLGECYRQLLFMSYRISHACNAQESMLTILVFESTNSPDNSSFLLYRIHLCPPPPSFPLRLRPANMRIHSSPLLFTSVRQSGTQTLEPECLGLISGCASFIGWLIWGW